MRTLSRVVLLFAFVAALTSVAGDATFVPPTPPELKWVDLLAGKLEDQWSDVNTAINSPTYALKADPDNPNGQVLAITRKPTGLIRSMKHYENFILECDWRHLTEAPTSSGTKDTTGNSGLYVWSDPLPTVGGHFSRAVEVQVCNLGNSKSYTSHGDVFAIWGAKLTPDPRFAVRGSRSMPIEFRAKKTGDWNHIRVTCVDGTIYQEMNGALVSGGFRASPRKGYLAIESEGGPVEFKNMRIHELPPDPELKEKDVAVMFPAGTMTTCLYNGVNLDAVVFAGDQHELWKANDHVLQCTGKTAGDGLDFMLPIKNSGEPDFTLVLDWTDEKDLPFTLVSMGSVQIPIPVSYPDAKKGWNRAKFVFQARTVTISINDQKVAESAFEFLGKHSPRLRLKNPGRPVSFSNIMLVESPKK